MYISVARSTGGKTLIRLGTGDTVDVEAGGALETEAESVVCSVPFISSEIIILSWNSASISGTTVAGTADCLWSVLYV